MSNGRFFIVEDEYVVAENLRTELESMGHEIAGLAASGEEALALARRDKPDLVLMDIKIHGGMDGVETAARLRRELDIPVVFLTAFADDGILARAKHAEPLGYLIKPFERRGLRAAIEIALYKARMERRLKESESRFRRMFDNSPVAYLALDAQDRCRDHNAELQRLLGYDPQELAGRDFIAFWPSGTHHLYGERFAGRKSAGAFQTELDLARKDGTTVAVILDARAAAGPEGEPLRVHCVLHDITERKRVEAQRLDLATRLQQAQKAESLARMAGAIAHHFNNILSVVMGYLDFAIEDLPPGSHARQNINESMKASQRAAGISRLLLTYLGQVFGAEERLDLGQTAEESLTLLRPSIPLRVGLEIRIESVGMTIQGDGTQIRQILTNLVMNAVEAIGEAEGRVAVGLKQMDAAQIRETRLFPTDFVPKAGRYACLSVADSGPGMDDETLDRIFDPFFTTHFTGRGMGLPTVLGLMRAFAGAIAVTSRPRGGAVFRVYFPLTKEKDGSPGKATGETVTQGDAHEYRNRKAETSGIHPFRQSEPGQSGPG